MEGDLGWCGGVENYFHIIIFPTAWKENGRVSNRPNVVQDANGF